jgi:adenosylcobinamide-phosphate synthase
MTDNLVSLLPMALAIALDLALGDPPNRFHPVAWIGSGLMAARSRLPTRGRLVPLLCGAGLMALGIAGAVGLGPLIDLGLADLPRPAALLAEAIALKSLFSIRGLIHAARTVAEALASGDLAGARKLASWHLVGRPTEGLDAPRVAAATIESVAENASDSVVGTLMFYAVGGLAGALVYRVINTADSVLGHRDPEREWLGKVPARLDDLANLIPARLTALMMILAAPSVGGSPTRAFWIWWRDCLATASPNAGHPMSAAAGVLGVELEKVGHYRLGEGLRLPEIADIGRAIRLFLASLALAAIPIGGLRLLLGARP